MGNSFDVVVRGGRCVLPEGTVPADVGVLDGRIAAIGDLGAATADERIDATRLHVLPGAIDPQVHFREPGFEHKEDLETGTRAAVLGGITSIFEMPNTDPPTTTAAALADKFARAKGRAWCDHAFFVGATPDNAEELGGLEGLPGCAGVKVFMGKSTGNLLVDTDADLRRVLASGTRRVAVHAEDEQRLEARYQELDLDHRHDLQLHPEWRDVDTALIATRRLLALARETGRPVHVLHVTTAEEVALLRQHREIATFECTPQHLLLAAPECYAELGSLVKMNPPIRDARHRDALWSAVADGTLDAIASDHAPHTLEEKAKPFPACPSGMTGVQTLLPLLLDAVACGRLSLERLVELCCEGPARVYRARRKGRIAIGADADLVLVDLAARRRIENAWIASRCGWTPFDGREVTGWPVATIVRGRTVVRDDEVQGPPRGLPVEFDS
jgi:dihydroorotase